MNATSATLPVPRPPALPYLFTALFRLAQSWVHLAALTRRRLLGVGSRTPVLIERENFLVKTVDHYWELEAALRLRYRVYRDEYGIPEQPYEMDVDAFDAIADHLVIINKMSGAVIGTYRLLCSNRVDRFYSEEEFDLTGLLHQPGVKVELGRACIAPEFRNGATLALLWRGLLAYCQAAGADTLFGCSSVKTTESREVARLVLKLRGSGHLVDRLAVTPRGDYHMDGLSELIEQERGLGFDVGRVGELSFSPLLQIYLKAGAKIMGLPALDRAFHCIDFFTVLDLRSLTAAYGKRFSA